MYDELLLSRKFKTNENILYILSSVHHTFEKIQNKKQNPFSSQAKEIMSLLRSVINDYQNIMMCMD